MNVWRINSPVTDVTTLVYTFRRAQEAEQRFSRPRHASRTFLAATAEVGTRQKFDLTFQPAGAELGRVKSASHSRW